MLYSEFFKHLAIELGPFLLAALGASAGAIRRRSLPLGVVAIGVILSLAAAASMTWSDLAPTWAFAHNQPIITPDIGRYKTAASYLSLASYIAIAGGSVWFAFGKRSMRLTLPPPIGAIRP